MIEYGVIGIGNCGGQVAKLVADLLDKPAAALNTSEQDLDHVGSKVIQWRIGDNKGAGQNRTTAQVALKADMYKLLEKQEFKDFVDKKELMFIVSSTGGGTGSGISPILYKLLSEMLSCPIIMIGVLPCIGEGRGIQENSASWLNDVYNVIENARYMLYDNNKMVSKSSVDMFKIVNKQIVHDINVISGFFNHSTGFASIDDRDMLEIISPAGRIIVGSAENILEKDLDTNSIEDMLINDLKASCNCEMDRDNICTNTALIADLSAKLNATLDMNIPKVHQFTGEPKATGFKHISINEDDVAPNNVFVIATGLSPVNDRINKIAERIHQIDDAEKDLPSASALKNIELKKSEAPTTSTEKTVDVKSIFGEFGL